MFTPHHVSHVTCHMSCVRCQVSGVKCQVSGVRCQVSGVTCCMSHVRSHVSCNFLLFFFFFYKVVELAGGGSVINEAYPVQFALLLDLLRVIVNKLFITALIKQEFPKQHAAKSVGNQFWYVDITMINIMIAISILENKITDWVYPCHYQF